MDFAFKTMLFFHISALAVGTTATVAMPLLGRELATGHAAAKPALGSIAARIQVYSRFAIAVLIVTGAAMLLLRFDGNVAALGPWFALKMALVLLVIAGMTLSQVAPGYIKPQVLGPIMKLSLFGIIATAVLTFG